MTRQSSYLKLLESHRIIPNFWCSEEYFQKAKLKVVKYATGNIGVEDTDSEGKPIILFPRIRTHTGLISDPPFWSDFDGVEYPSTSRTEFLDYEFIYDPKNFLIMEGGQWQVFRKNCRKFPRRIGIENLRYIDITLYDYPVKMEELFVAWLIGIKPDALVEEEKVILRYLLEGEHRKILVDDQGIIYGINIWDENYHYINYRYCFCRKGDFLSEFMRFLFYTDEEIQKKNKLVNDGGCLGSEELKHFKEKLNPVKIREVKTHYRKEKVAMDFIPVESSNIGEVGYDAEAGELHVKFLTGSVFKYEGVPEETFQSFLASASKGKFFAEHIKAWFRSSKVS